MKAEHLEFIKKYEYTVVYVGAEWCPPCKVLKPLIKKLVEESEGVGLLELDVDTDDVKGQEEFAHIRSIPYVMIYQFGELIKGGNLGIAQIKTILSGKPDAFTAWLLSQIEGGSYAYDRRLYRNGPTGVEVSKVGLKKIEIPDNFWMYAADDTVGRSFKSFIDMQQRQIRSDLNYFIDDRGELYFEDEHIKTKEAWDNIEQDLLRLKIEPGDELIIEHEKNMPLVESVQKTLGKVAKKEIIKPKKTKKND